MVKRSSDQTQLGLWSGQQTPARGRRPAALPSGVPPARLGDRRELWDIADVANYLGVPKQTVYSWRCTGYGPQGFRVGRHVRWHPATVIAWTLELERDA